MTSMKNSSQSTASKASSSKFSIEVDGILGVTFESFGAVTRSKAATLGQKALQVSSASTPIFGSLTPKGASSSINALEGGRCVAEKIKKILALLEKSGSKTRQAHEGLVCCKEELKAKAQIVVYTKELQEDEGSSYHVTIRNEHDALPKMKFDEELEDIVCCCHISVNDNEPLEEEDARDGPPELEKGVKTTIDPLKEVNLGTDKDPRPTYLSAFLEVDEEIAYMNILKEYRDVFIWSYKEMPGLNPKVTVHQLAIKNGSRLIKQAQRRFRPDLVPFIENEVNKIIKAGFIREVKYPTWISSIVPVRKKNGPKDEFALSILKLMIEATTGYEVIPFMNGSSSYNQIRMAPKDEELTAFCTPKEKPPVLAVHIPGKPLILYIAAQESWKGQALADILANHPIPDDWELTDDLSDEDVMSIEIQLPWKIYFDGTAHRGGSGACVLVINQLLGSCEVKKPELPPYHDYAQKLIGWLRDVTLQHVHRTENKKVDALASLASTLSHPDQAQSRTKIGDNPLLTTCVMGYFRKIQGEGLTFAVVHLTSFTTRTLYRRSFEGVLLRCLGEEEAVQALQEAHSGMCGSHQSGPKLHFHIKRMGYYWATMVKDFLYYARRCNACQFHANFIHQSPKVLHPTIASWPFDAWGLDIVGPLPKSFSGQLYILAAINYFSKWAEAVALKDVKKENIANFIRVNSIYRFGIPR
ncbi:uncharacterized protein LOC125809066 [Solanum verrucosum]|uniref:uncharacterized protein LOC125809066 n=1 Tax=Solanum verrucosum TaxID=315347 RepID=UPI0020D1DC6B|nr:uncharacterized protein LOC125809066 [Solanum verrucosum]